ncbi:MAG: phosphate/phosphite/phosphonate ABC transporter substrate-binding protein [Gammaproteobacteria bacterium]|nr:phosphate/phosphite/phosphonate ABC transporter substrate-binding protein [Gammaproteobacteria bacterium]
MTTLLLLLYPAFSYADEVFTSVSSISVSVDHSDGGRQSDRQMRNLLTALNSDGCRAIVNKTSNQAPAQLHFDPMPVSISKLEDVGYRLIARAITLEGKSSIRGAILVHASTGIDELASLQGQRIAFVSKNSPTGYQEPLKLLFDAGVKERWDTFFYVGNHIGAISMLLHSDTDVAVAAEPLAQRWAEYNGLSVVAVSDEGETGGWWIHESVPNKLIRNCARALENLDRSNLKVLPAWIGGFRNVLSSG